MIGTYFTYNPLKVYYFVLLVLLVASCSKKKKHAEKMARTYHNLAMVELGEDPNSSKQWHKALEYTDKALACQTTAKLAALKATLLFLMGNKEQSMHWFSKALSLSPTAALSGEIKNNYACLLADAGREQQALAIWQQLYADAAYMTPEVALLNQGKVMLKQKKFYQARTYFAQALELAPAYLEARFYLGLAALELNDKQQANDCAQTLLYLDKNYVGTTILAKRTMG